MPPFWIMISVLALAACAYFLGRARAIRSVDGNTRRLHSRPGYYAWNAALFTAVPALMLLLVWTLAQPLAVNQVVRGHLPADVMADAESRSLVLADVQRTARGLTAAVARGVLSAGEAAALGADDAPAMERLAEADIEIAKTPEVLAAARDYLQRLKRAFAWATTHQDAYAKAWASESKFPLAVARAAIPNRLSSLGPVTSAHVASEQRLADRLVQDKVIPTAVRFEEIVQRGLI